MHRECCSAGLPQQRTALRSLGRRPSDRVTAASPDAVDGGGDLSVDPPENAHGATPTRRNGLTTLFTATGPRRRVTLSAGGGNRLEAGLPAVPVRHGKPELVAGAAHLERGQRSRVEVEGNTGERAEPFRTPTLLACPHVSLCPSSVGLPCTCGACTSGSRVCTGASSRSSAPFSWCPWC